MELLVAGWVARLTLFAALLVGGLSLQAGLGPLDAALRAAFAAFVFTTAGRIAISLLETPEQRLLRLRAKRERARAKGATGARSAAVAAEPSARTSR